MYFIMISRVLIYDTPVDTSLNRNIVLHKRQLTFIPMVRFLMVPYSSNQRISCLINHPVLHMAGTDLCNSYEKWRSRYMKANVLRSTLPHDHMQRPPKIRTPLRSFQIFQISISTAERNQFNLFHAGHNLVKCYRLLPCYSPLHHQTRSAADDFKISINSARTEKAMEYYFHHVVKPWNTIPYHVRSTRCNNNEIVPFKSWLTKHYMHLTLTYYDIDNVCTWVSFCRCSSCRPAWMKHNNHTCSTVHLTFSTNPHVYISTNVPCVMLYQQQCKWHQVGSHVWLGMCLDRIVATATAAPSFPQDLIQWQLCCP